jgi:N-acetylmuramoyl-L-alanine amidase
MDSSETVRETSSEAQRSRRAAAPVRPPFMNPWRALQTVASVAVLVASLFTIWSPNALFSNDLTDKMALAFQTNQATPTAAVLTTATPRGPNNIGIVAGHWGNDSGAVCPDGLTEADVNLKIATLVQQDLKAKGYEVELLKEFDERLKQYQAMVLLSIHNDSCDYINDEATGFKVASTRSSTSPAKADRLTACLVDRYRTATGMNFHYNSITRDMTDYHAFDEINTSTTAAIIETGFLNLDRQILTEKTDVVAHGITAGIMCFIQNESIQPTAVPTLAPTPTDVGADGGATETPTTSPQ